MALDHQIGDVRKAFVTQLTKMPIDDILVAVIGAAADIFLRVRFHTLGSPVGQGSG